MNQGLRFFVIAVFLFIDPDTQAQMRASREGILVFKYPLPNLEALFVPCEVDSTSTMTSAIEKADFSATIRVSLYSVKSQVDDLRRMSLKVKNEASEFVPDSVWICNVMLTLGEWANKTAESTYCPIRVHGKDPCLNNNLGLKHYAMSLKVLGDLN